MQASSRWDSTRGDLCSCLHARATDFTSRIGYRVLVSFFYFDLTEGSQGTSPFDLRYHRENGFGHARSERRRPQFTAHNSVRPFENGLRSLGSSATRPTCIRHKTRWALRLAKSHRTWRVYRPRQLAREGGGSAAARVARLRQYHVFDHWQHAEARAGT